MYLTPRKTKDEREYIVVKSNLLIQKSRYNLSRLSFKVLTRILQKIKPQMTPDDYIEFDIREFLIICGKTPNSGKNYKNVLDALAKLKDSCGYIPKVVRDDNGDLTPEIDKKGQIVMTAMSWLSYVEVRPGEGRVKVLMDKSVEPHIYNQERNFARFFGLNVYVLDHKMSPFLYEYFLSFITVPKQRRTLEQLIDATGGTHKTWGQINAKVLKPCIEEINKYSDIHIEYKPHLYGKKFMYVDFVVSKKDIIEKRHALQESHKKLDNQLMLAGYNDN